MADLKSRWREDAHALRPDVLTLLVGVNDTLAAMQGAANTWKNQCLTLL